MVLYPLDCKGFFYVRRHRVFINPICSTALQAVSSNRGLTDPVTLFQFFCVRMILE